MAKLGFWGYWVFIPSVDIVGAPGSGRAMWQWGREAWHCKPLEVVAVKGEAYAASDAIGGNNF
jgi:hypothetical protein